ncbi:MAG TPA: hypothetical protein PLL49_06945 [Bacteroidales bacterium]|nr:hypothetical protein [Bacteroidales bacterium]
MKKSTSLFIVIMILSSVISYGQKTKQLKQINSQSIIEEGVRLHDQGKYDEAIQLYKQIPISDSLYILAQYEIAYANFVNEKYKEALMVAEPLRRKYDDHVRMSSIYALIGSSYLNLKVYDQGIEVVNEGLTYLPYSVRLYLTLGTLYSGKEAYKEAELAFKNALFCTPSSQITHFRLGEVFIQQGRTIPAILALNYAVFLNPKTEIAIFAIQKLQQYYNSFSEDTDNFPTRPMEDAELIGEWEQFSELEFWVKSEVALKRNFHKKSKIRHNVNSQNQLVFENLPEPSSSKDVIQFLYIPFFRQIMQDREFSLYAHYFFSGTDLEEGKIEKKAQKMSKKIDKMVSKGIDFLKERISRGIGVPDELPPLRQFEYNYENGLIQGVGGYTQKNGSGESMYNGNWQIINDDGGITAELNLNNDIRNGVSTFYYHGEKQQVVPYLNGKVDGTAWVYFPDLGLEKQPLRISIEFKNDNLEGVRKEYNRYGVLIEEAHYKNDLLHGEKLNYSSTGLLYSKGELEEGNYVGEYIEYFPNGEKSLECYYGKEDEEGMFRSYYPDGKLYKEATIINEAFNGVAKTYYPNGKLSSVGSYIGGELDGFWTGYYPNGAVSDEVSYNYGVYNGTSSFYSPNGFLYSQTQYNEGIITKITTYHPNKEIRKEYTGDLLKGDIEVYNEYGQLTKKYRCNEKGQEEGVTTFYYPTGKIKRTIPYVEGEPHGENREYYPNGNLKAYRRFNKGEFDGLQIYYHINDSIESEGYMQNGNKVGSWYWYNLDGSLSHHEEHKNESVVYTALYYPSGSLREEYFYDLNGTLVKHVIYNHLGEVLHTNQFQNGEGTMENYYLNGTLLSSGKYRYNKNSDSTTFYDIDGKELFEIPYLNGEMHGIITSSTPEDPYYKAELPYLFGKQHGTVKVYDNRVLVREINYEHGSKSGARINYYPNGKIRSTVPYINDVEEGEGFCYGDDGKTVLVGYHYLYGDLIAVAQQKKDQKGLQKWEPITQDTTSFESYYPNKKLAKKVQLINGEQNGEFLVNGSNGKPLYHFYQTHNLMNGHYLSYYHNGNKRMEGDYWFDQLHGAYQEWYEDGVIKIKGNYYLNEPHGEFNFYDSKGYLLYTLEFYYGSVIQKK